MSFIRNALPRRSSSNRNSQVPPNAQHPDQLQHSSQQFQQQPSSKSLLEPDFSHSARPSRRSAFGHVDQHNDYNGRTSSPNPKLHHQSSAHSGLNMYSKDLPPPPPTEPTLHQPQVNFQHHTLDPKSMSTDQQIDMSSKSMKRRNFKKLSLGGPSLAAAPRQTAYKVMSTESTSSNSNDTSSSSRTQAFTIEAQEQPSRSLRPSRDGGNTQENELLSQFSTLDLNVESKPDLKKENIRVLRDLGSGNGGTVSLAQYIPTGLYMARKVIPIDANPEMRKQILRELHFMQDCNFPHIVSYYGAFLNERDVVMCMEYMDKGSLDTVYKTHGPIAEPIIGKITEAVVEGLNYLYDKHRIIHRDVKPSNILINHEGQIKLCDFGVSGELNNSIANTFVGTSTYMSPERIQGAAYSVKSDVWSVGITLLELAIGYFPWEEVGEDGRTVASPHPMGILDMLQRIAHEPPPKLPENGNFTKHFRAFIDRCLSTEDQRPTPKELFVSTFFQRLMPSARTNLLFFFLE